MRGDFMLTLAALRVNKGHTQEEMATIIGVNKNTWRNWEKCRTFPAVPYIEKIQEYFGVEYQNINFCPVLYFKYNNCDKNDLAPPNSRKLKR